MEEDRALRPEKPKRLDALCAIVEPEFDAATLALLREQMGEEYDELRALFERESGRHLEELRLGIETEAWDRARRAAHSLKSSAAIFGLVALSGVMREIEHLPRETPASAWEDRLAEAQRLRKSGLARLTTP